MSSSIYRLDFRRAQLCAQRKGARWFGGLGIDERSQRETCVFDADALHLPGVQVFCKDTVALHCDLFIVVIFVLTLTHRRNLVCGHRICCSNSGVEERLDLNGCDCSAAGALFSSVFVALVHRCSDHAVADPAPCSIAMKPTDNVHLPRTWSSSSSPST